MDISMENLLDNLKTLIDSQNRPFKHLRKQYDSELITLIESALKDEFKEVKINRITINKNNRLGKHKHPNQKPISYAYIFGNFTGGELVSEDKTISVKNKWFIFNGTKEHYVKDFTGNRYSIIAYNR